MESRSGTIAQGTGRDRGSAVGRGRRDRRQYATAFIAITWQVAPNVVALAVQSLSPSTRRAAEGALHAQTITQPPRMANRPTSASRARWMSILGIAHPFSSQHAPCD